MGKRLLFLLLIMSVLIFSGCGGVSDSLGGGGGTGGGGNYHISIASYDVNPKTITQGTSFEINWDIDYNGVAGYWVEFHMNSQNSIPSNAWDLTKHFNYNCEMGPGTCGKKGTVRCEVKKDNTGSLFTECRPTWTSNPMPTVKGIIFSGNGYAILKACTYDSSMETICNEKSIPISVL